MCVCRNANVFFSLPKRLKDNNNDDDNKSTCVFGSLHRPFFVKHNSILLLIPSLHHTGPVSLRCENRLLTVLLNSGLIVLPLMIVDGDGWII